MHVTILSESSHQEKSVLEIKVVEHEISTGVYKGHPFIETIIQNKQNYPCNFARITLSALDGLGLWPTSGRELQLDNCVSPARICDEEDNIFNSQISPNTWIQPTSTDPPEIHVR